MRGNVSPVDLEIEIDSDKGIGTVFLPTDLHDVLARETSLASTKWESGSPRCRGDCRNFTGDFSAGLFRN